MINKKFVIKELVENKDYEENLEEILEVYFRTNPSVLDSWIRWFSGEKMNK